MIYNLVNLPNQNAKRKWHSELLEKGYGWEVNGELPNHGGKLVGVDPGVNFGITFIDGEYVRIFNGKLKTLHENRTEYSKMAHDLIFGMLEEFDMTSADFILEGAAFNKQFGQVNLAEVRTGYYLGMRHFGEVTVAAPMSIRKIVMGDGKVQPGETWPLLNHNGADSLSIALYGLR
jgi:hypothetical protein